MSLAADFASSTERAYLNADAQFERAEHRRARRQLAEDRTPPAPARRQPALQACACDLCHAATWRARHTATAARAA